MYRKTTEEKNYRGYDINNGKSRDFSCYTRTLDQIIEMSEYMLTNHSKGLFLRLDIRNEADGEKQITRKDMTRILESVQRKVESKYRDSPNQPDMNYVWTTENEPDRPHFHLYLGLNGNAIQNGYSIFDETNKAIKKFLQTDNNGLVEYSGSNSRYGILVNRQSDEMAHELERAIYAGSYLAKTRTKENRPKGARVSSASRLPKNWQDNIRYKEMFDNDKKNTLSGQEVREEYDSGSSDNFTCMYPPLDDGISFDE